MDRRMLSRSKAGFKIFREADIRVIIMPFAGRYKYNGRSVRHGLLKDRLAGLDEIFLSGDF